MIKNEVRFLNRKNYNSGFNFSILTLRIKQNFLRLISLRKTPGNVFYGFNLYNKPLLVSYSRSGTNWIRYFIELTTEKPTPGQKRLVRGNDYYIDRAHAGFSKMASYNKTILLVRNYRECIIRHHGIKKIRKNYRTIKSFLDDDSLKQPVSWYIKNMREFENLKNDKLLIYYEDLITKPSKNLTLLGEFLEIEKSKVSSFIDNIEYHKSKSIKAYTSCTHRSETKGNPSKTNYHSSKLGQKEITEFDSYFKEKDIYLFNKYLKRYEFDKPVSLSRDDFSS